MRGYLLLTLVLLTGCASQELTESDRWWLNPPVSATHVAFQQSGKWGYRDREGKTIIAPQFDYACSFPGLGDVLVTDAASSSHYQLSAQPIGRVRIGDRWGYIDGAGKILIQPQFEKARDFFAELTAVQVGGKWGFIDRSGQMKIAPRFDDASPFLKEVAHVREGARWFTIDATGKDTSQ